MNYLASLSLGKNAFNTWCGPCLAVSKPGFSLSSPLKIDLHLHKSTRTVHPLNVATPKCKTEA